MNFKWTAALALALGAGFATYADAKPPVAAPTEPAAKAPDVDIPYETFTLKNGLRVVVSTDRKAPVVAVGVWYGVGSRDEVAGKTGFAHLFEHLMFNGTENFKDEFFKPFEEVGATDQNGTTWFDRTNYFETVPKTALDLALWMESDRMGHLLGAIDQKTLDEQRGVVQNEKRQGDNQPYGTVEYSQLSGLFPAGHPYSWSTIGSMADLNAASLEDVKTWFKSYYGAGNAVLALAGDIDAATARPLVEKYFGDIDPGPPVVRRDAAVPVRTENTRDVLRDRVPQARIYRAWAVPGTGTHDAVLLGLAADAFGQGKSSPLYQALVVDQKIATDVSAYLEDHELASMLKVEVKLAKGVDIDVARQKLDAEIEKYLARGPSAAELERVKMRNLAAFVRGVEKVGGFSGKMTVLAEGWLYSDDPGHYKQELAWMRDAKPADVAASARSWMKQGYHQVDVVPFGNLAASDQHADRSKPPAVTDTPSLTFPALEQGTLSNGAKIVVARRTGAPLVEISAQFEGGYTSDVGKKLGLASFAAAMLDEGTKTKTAAQVSDEAERLGARLNSGAGLETTSVRLSALKANLAPSLALWADVIRNPSFAPNELDRVRRTWLAQIEQEKAEPVSLALRLLPPAIYGEGSAYGAPLTGSGTEESIASLTREDLIAYHDQRIRPDNATIFVVGDISLAEATAALETALAGWKAPASAVPSVAPATAPPRTAPRLILVDRPGAQQTFILVGRATTPANAKDVIAQEMMNDALGGLFTSRVNMNLREDKHWAYGAFTFFQNGRGPRPWLVYAPVQTDKTKESLAELQKELADVNGKRPITAEELEKVRASSMRSLPGSFETSANVLGALTSASANARPLEWTASLTDKYRAVTLPEAQAAAKEIVTPNDLVWMVVGDRAKIEAGVKGLNIAPMEVWDENGKPVK